MVREYDSVWSLYERFLFEGDNLRNYIKDEKRKSKVKEELINRLVKLDEETALSRLRAANSLLSEIIRALNLMGASTLVVDARITYKGLLGSSQGLGSSVFEVGLTWDPVLDLPVIPGSSFKGAVRGFCIECLRGKGMRPAEAENLCSALLGRAGERGYVSPVVFLDALPISTKDSGRSKGFIEKDVLNPHYNAFMRSDLRMELDVTPVPVIHLGVGEGVQFRFIAYIPCRASEILAKEKKTLEELCRVLNLEVSGSPLMKAMITTAYLVGGALRLGIGARTLKGYGRFEIVSSEVRIRA